MGLCLNRLFYQDVGGLVTHGFHKVPRYQATVAQFPVSGYMYLPKCFRLTDLGDWT